MTIEYQQEYQLRTGDFDRYEHLQPASVLDIFQDAAGLNAEHTPTMGFHEMKENGLFWAITRIKYEIVRQPAMHERVMVRTWPLAPTKAGIQRDYIIHSLAGDLLVKGTSRWIIMDFATRGFVNVAETYTGPHDFTDETVATGKLRKLKTIEATGTPYMCKPAFTDIDVNGHVNNIRYANFALNALEPDEGQEIKSMQIDYRHEVHAGDTLHIYTGTRDTGELVAQGMLENGEVSFVCQFALA